MPSWREQGHSYFYLYKSWSEPVKMLYAPVSHLAISITSRWSTLFCATFHKSRWPEATADEHLQTAGTRILTLDEVPSVHITSGSDRHIGNIRVWLRHCCISGNSQWSHWPCRVTSHSHLRQPGFNSISSVKLRPMPLAHELFGLITALDYSCPHQLNITLRRRLQEKEQRQGKEKQRKNNEIKKNWIKIDENQR